MILMISEQHAAEPARQARSPSGSGRKCQSRGFEGISPPGVRDHSENGFNGNSLINCKGNLDTV